MKQIPTQMIPIGLVETNKGQVPGLPRNPRLIKDDHFRKLKKSIEDNPEMLYLRELLVYPHQGKYVTIGGNGPRTDASRSGPRYTNSTRATSTASCRSSKT